MSQSVQMERIFLKDFLGERWHRVSSRLIYKSKHTIVHLDDVKLNDGTTIRYTRVDHLPFVVVVPTIADKVILICNYRYPVDEWCLELPSGHIDKGENPSRSAYRELKEETGYDAKELHTLGWYYPSSARSKRKSYVFVAKVAEQQKTKRDKSELQKVIVLPLKVVYKKLFEGEIKHAASIIALALSQPFLYKSSGLDQNYKIEENEK